MGLGDQSWIDLKRRDIIPGIRYGIEGMQVGSSRRIVIPPHLAYRAQGLPGLRIPPHALLVCTVDLLELRPTRPTKPKLKLALERKRQQAKE